eukprot:TRINITY_DN38897_c0_g1_i1.p1 TRINITY_DN38897_c0_g1~~TRINITY_DN38897_c0_g1_i1.p1  ORF type:complete len:429 (-),score=49.11 TRINITY_DN38897_c0_g1_i1:235-1521(-)
MAGKSRDGRAALAGSPRGQQTRIVVWASVLAVVVGAASPGPGDCKILAPGQSRGAWQQALAGGPVLAQMTELLVHAGQPIEPWLLFPDETPFDFSLSREKRFYTLGNDAASPVGLRRTVPARLQGGNWGLVRELVTYLLARGNSSGHDVGAAAAHSVATMPERLRSAVVRNEQDVFGEGAVPLAAALEFGAEAGADLGTGQGQRKPYHMYVSGESGSELHEPSSPALRAIGAEVERAMGRKWEVSNVWVSPGDTESNLHFDGGDNWLCQLAGEKEAVLYSARATEPLYPIGFMKKGDRDFRHVLRADGEMHDVPLPPGFDDKIYSAVAVDDELAPDLARFPAYKRAKTHRKVCRIAPGQCLGIPHHHWHNIKARRGELNLSLNFGFDDSAGASGGSWGPEQLAEMSARMAEMDTRDHLRSMHTPNPEL